MLDNQNLTKLTVCIDLDGVLAEYDGWRGVEHIGDHIPGAINFVNNLAEKYRIVIHTTRVNPEFHSEHSYASLKLIVSAWLDKHGFKYNDIQSKPIAVAYVDDRAVSCRPQTMFKHSLDVWGDTINDINFLTNTI